MVGSIRNKNSKTKKNNFVVKGIPVHIAMFNMPALAWELKDSTKPYVFSLFDFSITSHSIGIYVWNAYIHLIVETI